MAYKIVDVVSNLTKLGKGVLIPLYLFRYPNREVGLANKVLCARASSLYKPINRFSIVAILLFTYTN